MSQQIKCLYANGDSFSFGQELINKPMNFYEFTQYQREHTYQIKIADFFKVEKYINAAVPGCSNDSIFRRTTLDVLDLLEKYDASEIFIQCAFTQSSRREFYNESDKKYFDYLNNNKPLRTEYTKQYAALWDVYTAYFDSLEENKDRYTVQVTSLRSFLEVNKISYLFTESIPVHSIMGAEKLIFIDIDERLKNTNYIHKLPFSTFVWRSKFESFPQGHPKEIAHSAWGDYLVEYIKTNKLVDL